MADSIPDIEVNETWLDIYAATSIVVGTPILIQNKTSDDAFVWLGSVSPAFDERHGFVLETHQAGRVEAGATGCWVWADGPINVQEL